MPIIRDNELDIDYIDQGNGPAVLLVHSSVSGNRQWSQLIEALQDRYRLLAINLYGYGETTPWHGARKQKMEDQVALVNAMCAGLSEMPDAPISIVGHSFGGSIAMEFVRTGLLPVKNLVLLEPNPFWLLMDREGSAGYLEISALGRDIRAGAERDDWDGVSARFADYWLGDGAWQSMPDRRRAAFTRSLKPNYYEWDAVEGTRTPIGEYAGISARTLVVSDPKTRSPIREIVKLFELACPHWLFREFDGIGHMGPLTHPDVVNPVIAAFLDQKKP